MRVLVSAYACEPGQGSEAGVGWNWVLQISRFHEVWVITRANNRQPIEKALLSSPLPNVHWVYFDLPRWARFWKTGQRGVHLYYCLWQLGAYLAARNLNRRVRFDLVHHVTLVNYWMPTFMVLLPVPLIWGPVGGGESAPRALRRSFSVRGKLHELCRDTARFLGELNPLVKMTARRSVLSLATTKETEERLRLLGSRNIRILSAIGLAKPDIERLDQVTLRSRGPFRLLSVGRLIHWKGFELGLRAFAQFQSDYPDAEYWIAGDGPERKRLKQLVDKLGVAGKARFLGQIPRGQALERLAECDVLVHPSLHDSGGWACLEAMAAGRPVICLNLGGPAVQVTEETGIKVPAITPGQAVADLAKATLRLAQDAGLRARMGKASRRRVADQFSWDKKGALIAKLYD